MPRRTPGALLLFGVPLLVCLGVVLIGAAHAGLGMPLGPGFASEVWGLAKTAMMGTVVYLPFAAYVRRHNAAISPAPGRTIRRDDPPSTQHPPHAALSSQDSRHQPPRLTTGRHRIVIELPGDGVEIDAEDDR